MHLTWKRYDEGNVLAVFSCQHSIGGAVSRLPVLPRVVDQLDQRLSVKYHSSITEKQSGNNSKLAYLSSRSLHASGKVEFAASCR